MRRKRISAKLLAMAVALICCSFATNALASICPACPTDVPPTNIPWNSGAYTTTLTVNGVTCEVTICYCYRETSPGNDDYFISRVVNPHLCWGMGYSADLI